MPISDKTIQTLQKVNGVCKNWRDEISKSEDCRPSNYNDPDDVQDNNQGQAPGNQEQTEPQVPVQQQMNESIRDNIHYNNANVHYRKKPSDTSDFSK